MLERAISVLERLTEKLDHLSEHQEDYDLFTYIHEDTVYYAQQLKDILVSMLG